MTLLYKESVPGRAIFTTGIFQTFQKAFTFQAHKDFRLEKIMVILSKSLSTIADSYCELQETTNGEPNGTVIKSVTITSEQLELSGKNFEILMNADLVEGTTYAVVFRSDESTGQLIIRITENNRSFGGGAYYESTDSGSSWVVSVRNIVFEVHGRFKGEIGRKEIARRHPVQEGLIAGTTKQTGRRFLTPQNPSLANSQVRGT